MSIGLGGKSDYELKEIHRKSSLPFSGNTRTRDEAEKLLKQRGYNYDNGVSWSTYKEVPMTPKEAEEDRQASLFFMRIGLVVFCAYFLYVIVSKYIPALMTTDMLSQSKSQPIKYSYINILIWYGFTFLSAFILFYKSSFMKLYAAFLGLLFAYGWYGFQLFETNSLTNNMTISILLITTAIISMIPKINYYIRAMIITLAPLLGIYLTYTEYAMTWIMMMASGTLLLCRINKGK